MGSTRKYQVRFLLNLLCIIAGAASQDVQHSGIPELPEIVLRAEKQNSDPIVPEVKTESHDNNYFNGNNGYFQPSFGPPTRFTKPDIIFYPTKSTPHQTHSVDPFTFHDTGLNTYKPYNAHHHQFVARPSFPTFPRYKSRYYPKYHGKNYYPPRPWGGSPHLNVFDHHRLGNRHFSIPSYHHSKDIFKGGKARFDPSPHDFHSVVNYGLINVHHGDHFEPHHNGNGTSKDVTQVLPDKDKENVVEKVEGKEKTEEKKEVDVVEKIEESGAEKEKAKETDVEVATPAKVVESNVTTPMFEEVDTKDLKLKDDDTQT